MEREAVRNSGKREKKRGPFGLEVLDSWAPQLRVFVLSEWPTGHVVCTVSPGTFLPSTSWRQLEAYPGTTDFQ